MDHEFFGVYVTPEREIRIDANTSREDLFYVVMKLSDDLRRLRSDRLHGYSYEGCMDQDCPKCYPEMEDEQPDSAEPIREPREP